jgi:hypothetical protein
VFDPILPLRIHWGHALDTRVESLNDDIVDNFCLPAHCLAHLSFRVRGEDRLEIHV